MAAVLISTITPTPSYNLTDSVDFSTLVSGAGNGVKAVFVEGNILILKNDSGGAAVFTVKVNPIPSLTSLGLTTDDFTVSVANGKSYAVKVSSQFNLANYLTVECTVAGKVLVLNYQ